MNEFRKRSNIWIHFIDRDNGKAECRVCKVMISYRAGSTNNLHRHVRVVHPTTVLEKVRKVCDPSSTSAPTTSGISGTRSDSEIPDSDLDASEPDDPVSTHPRHPVASVDQTGR